VARYPLNTVGDLHNPHSSASVNALVRLRGGEAAVPVLREDVARIIGRPDIDVWNVAEEFTRPLERHTSFEARCLLAFAAAAFLAAVFLVGQAIARYAAASAAEMQTLRSLGMTPSQAIAAAASAPAIVGVLAAGVAVGAAYVASQWLPIGAAALAEPSPGLSADWAVFTPGLVLIWLLVAATGVLAAWSAVRAGRRPVAPRRSSVASAASRAGLPVPLVIGSRFALEAGRGPTSVPVRPALIGAVTGVLGILAAFTFSHGVSDAAGHPERFGQTFQLVAFLGDNGQTYGPGDTLTKALVADPDVTGVNDARVSVASGAKGIGSVTLYSYNAGAKPRPRPAFRRRGVACSAQPEDDAGARRRHRSARRQQADAPTVGGHRLGFGAQWLSQRLRRRRLGNRRRLRRPVHGAQVPPRVRGPAARRAIAAREPDADGGDRQGAP
jgi:hypothetical protein